MKVLIVLTALCTLAFGARVKQLTRTTRLDGRIVGGQNASIEDLPHQLSLQIDGRHMCGASIISPIWALTACHCVYYWDSVSLFSLRAGSTRLGQGGSVHQAAEVIRHPQYDNDIMDYDFALIRVEVPFDLGQPGIQAIQLADEEPSAGALCTASGWGALWGGGPSASLLQSVELPLILRERCQEEYYNYTVTNRMICAGVDEGGIDACQGDSGGPLISNNVLVGIVSWGFGCALPNNPGVYSNVANQREWIRQTSGI